MTWQDFRRRFIDGSDAVRVIGRATSGLKGIRRIAPRADALALGDELVIEVRPDEGGYLTLLVEIKALGKTVCLVPNGADDARLIEVSDGFEYPEEADPRIVLTEPTGVHVVYAAVSPEPLPEALRAEIAARQGDCDGPTLDEIARRLEAAPDKELHRRSFTVSGTEND